MIYANVDEQGQAELLQAMKKTNDKKWYRRLKIIDLSGHQFSVPILAVIFNLTPQTIRTYIQRFNSGGIEKLKPNYGKGRDLALDWTKDQWLALFGQAPSQFEQLNSGAQNWTQELMVEYLSIYHQVTVTQPAISTMLRRVGLKWKRAKLRIKSPDPLYVVKRQRVDSLKEKAQKGTLSSRDATHSSPDPPKPGLLFYLDSTDLHWCPDQGQVYSETGKQLKVDTPGYDNPWLALFGSLAFPIGEGVYSIHEHKRHQELIYHLQLLMNTYPDRFLFIVLDNASAHTTPKVVSFCAEHQDQIELVFLPTYSPHLNLIERLWRVLRHQVTRNQFFDSLDLLATAVVRWFEKYPMSKFCSLMGVDESQLHFV